MTYTTVVLLSTSILFPLMAGFSILDKTANIKKFLSFLVVGFLFEIILILTSFMGNNLAYFNAYSLIETGLLSCFFVGVLRHQLMKTIIYGAALMIVINGILNFKLNVIDSNMKVFESALFICSSLAYFFHTFGKRDVNAGLTLVIGGIFIFFTSTILIYSMSEWMIFRDTAYYHTMYDIHAIISFVVNIIYGIGLISVKLDDKLFIRNIKKRAVEEYVVMTTQQKERKWW